MRLEQKRGFSRREFELRDDSVWVKTKTSAETKEWSVKLETLGHQKLIEKKSKKGEIIGGSLFGAFGLFFIAVNLADKSHSLSILAWITIGFFYLFISSLILLIPRKKEMHIDGGQYSLSFFLDIPSRDEVEKFANVIIDSSKRILIKKYGTIDPDLPEETMMNQLNWLRNRDLISEDTFKDLKNEYKTRKLIR